MDLAKENKAVKVMPIRQLACVQFRLQGLVRLCRGMRRGRRERTVVAAADRHEPRSAGKGANEGRTGPSGPRFTRTAIG